MRILIAAAAIAAVVFSISGSAQAIPASPLAVQSEISIQNVQYECRRVQVCGPNGCFWRRKCAGGGYYGNGYYRGPYRGYYRRPCPEGWSLQDGVCKPYRGY